MFSKILIANRGEIACRLIRTARRMGIATVAVHSDADTDALHVELADEASLIGPAAAAESYLRGDRIIEAALAAGAQAIHPGYGFLSENPDFAEQVEAAGLVFIGPPASAIRMMGLKDAAKALMDQAGVPIVPGYHGDEQDAGFLADRAAEIGYPVLIKARAGGGGKGMRMVADPAAFAEALAGARREAEAGFGDPQVLIEKFIAVPRHIEIQIFGDDRGNAVHLYERDCSLQRRWQKVIEEAPAPGMSAPMRKAMGAAAVQAAKAVGYRGAGTVEFIVDASNGLREDAFYFMEMNTRLQVEHPVTEAVTGLDLVEWQFRIAAGAPLPLKQNDIPLDGHAFEARICAEDVSAGFLPASGRIDQLRFPSGVRVETGVRTGDTVSPHYDSMIAKLVVHGPTREVVLNRLRTALAGTRLAGFETNLAFLHALTQHEGFQAGEVDTGLIGRDLDALHAAAGTPLPVSKPAESQSSSVKHSVPKHRAYSLIPAVAALAGLDARQPNLPGDPFSRLGFWRLWGAASAEIELEEAGEPRRFRIESEGAARRVVSGDAVWDLHLIAPRSPEAKHFNPKGFGIDSRWTFETDMGRVSAEAFVGNGWVTVFLQGAVRRFAIHDPLERESGAASGSDLVCAPMSGLVKVVSVEPGQTVTSGQSLLVLEAMKMEHTLTAPRDGEVAEVAATLGDQVAEGQVLVALAPLHAGGAESDSPPKG